MKLSTEEAVKRYKDRLFIIAFNVCQNPADADDAVQDAFIKYDTFKKSFDDETHLRAWLIRVTINRTKDITSSFWRKHKETLEDYMENLVFEEPEDSRLFEVVMQLPEKYRVAIHLYKFDNGVCYVKLIHEQGELYLTVKYGDGYSFSPKRYISADSFN